MSFIRAGLAEFERAQLQLAAGLLGLAEPCKRAARATGVWQPLLRVNFVFPPHRVSSGHTADFRGRCLPSALEERKRCPRLKGWPLPLGAYSLQMSTGKCSAASTELS